ncbi:MAG TPA: acyl-CoA dehydrogenase family protein [Candidatus Krumholzibacteria bacterium]|nr:acyl-CoA dehydrogenase family protein [Candidatus Krumholzibacteria bacterium]HRX50168.1 acyl-CoA dehydrogenase family protein [Candidatus Krumholzibacteria bacterium]
MILNENQKMIRDMTRDFARSKVAPIAAAIDETGEFPEATVKEMGALGLLGLQVPEAYGGVAADTTSYALVVEELSRVCGSHGLTVAAHNSLGCAPIAKHGTEAQKQRWLPGAAAGEFLLSFGLTEPGAGSDAGGTRTTAVRDGNDWVLNGSKQWITNAHYAGAVIITAKTDPEATGSSGISAFIVPTDTPGFTVEKKEDKLGMRASDTAPLTLEDVRIPADNLLGAEGDGFKYFLETLDGGRISIGALSLGLAVGAFEASRRYAAGRIQFGKPIARQQAVGFMFADMSTDIDASRLLIYEAARQKDAGEAFGDMAAKAKLFASEAAMRVTYKAIQALGGYGFCREYPVERFYRDAKLCTIGEGTSEIQRMVIARNVFEDNS